MYTCYVRKFIRNISVLATVYTLHIHMYTDLIEPAGEVDHVLPSMNLIQDLL